MNGCVTSIVIGERVAEATIYSLREGKVVTRVVERIGIAYREV